MRNLVEHSQVIGRLGNDAQVNSVNDKTDVINFNLAIDKSYNKKNENGTLERVSKVKWISCSIYKKKGAADKVATYLKKGQEIVANGEYSVNAYLNKDQKPDAQLVLTIDSFTFLRKPEGAAATVPPVTEPSVLTNSDMSADAEEDDLPF